MKEICKYNIFKALSILITSIPTLLVALSFGNDIIQSSSKSISFTGLVGIFLAFLFLKNKIAENFKLPSPFIVSAVLFVLILFVESIIIPVKMTCLTVMIVCGIDELTFKRIYKRIELLLPDKKEAYKHLGFYVCKTETILGDLNDE